MNLKTEKDTPCSKSKVAAKNDPPKKRKGWKKPEGKPKRPLSAYNLFFQDERKKMLRKVKKGAKIGFANMARTIGGKWKTIDSVTRVKYEGDAKLEKKKYFVELAKWKQEQVVRNDKEKDGKENVAKVQKKKIVPCLATSSSTPLAPSTPACSKPTAKGETGYKCPTCAQTSPEAKKSISSERSTSPEVPVSMSLKSSVVTPPISPKTVIHKDNIIPAEMSLDSQNVEENYLSEFNFSFAQKVFDPVNNDINTNNNSGSQEDMFELPVLEVSDEDISEDDEFSDFALPIDFSRDIAVNAEAYFDVPLAL